MSHPSTPLLPDSQHQPSSHALAPLADLGQQANAHAARGLFDAYRARRSAATLRRHGADLASFSAYLALALGPAAPDGETLVTTPEAWAGVTWGLVEGYTRWLVAEGYALATVNARLSAVRIYARLAHQAGALPEAEFQRLRDVRGYKPREAREVDARRETTRRGAKKADPVRIILAQARALKSQPDTPQGRRDALLMCLLLDHGLRVSEVSDIMEESVDLTVGKLTFYRRKVDRTQTHLLTGDTLRALLAYQRDILPNGPLLRASRKDGSLREPGMTTRSITARVRFLGEAVGLAGLSAHDCRHYWATNAARSGTDAFALRDAGGWSSLAMPGRYVERATVANRDVKLET